MHALFYVKDGQCDSVFVRVFLHPSISRFEFFYPTFVFREMQLFPRKTFAYLLLYIVRMFDVLIRERNFNHFSKRILRVLTMI